MTDNDLIGPLSWEPRKCKCPPEEIVIKPQQDGVFYPCYGVPLYRSIM